MSRGTCGLAVGIKTKHATVPDLQFLETCQGLHAFIVSC